ncbi:MAG: poly-gamma-glutamate biosynthesis protein PgsC [Ignavibacteriaceae bacterium]
MITEALLVGLVIGIIYYELFDLSPGGVITPGYFALYADQPFRMLTTIAVALLTLVIINFLAKHLILYGKRKFLITLLTGFLLKMLLDFFLFPNINTGVELLTIGYIIPGLIANEMFRQSPLKTIYSLSIVTSVTYIIIVLIR